MSIKKNVKWVTVNQLTKIIIQLVCMIVLARLVEPSEYGIMSMALVVTVFATIFRDLGTSASIIQKNEIDEAYINTIFWINVFMGVGLCFIIMAISPFVAMLFHEPKLIQVLLLISISFPIVSLSSVHLALLERTSRFKMVALIEVSSTILGMLTAVTMAYFGFGVYSLVLQTLIVSIVSSILLWKVSTWSPKFRILIDKTILKDFFKFGGNITTFNVINYFSRNADNILIGHMFSAKILGAYSLSYRIMLFPLQSLTFVAGRALFPVMSRKQGNINEVRIIYFNVIEFISFIVFPLMAGLAVLREPFIYYMVGNGWGLSSEIILWLAPVGCIQSLVSTTGSVFMSQNKTNILLRLGVVGAVLQVGAFLIGIQYGIIVLCQLYLIANIVNFLVCMSMVMKLLKGGLFQVFKIITPSVIGSAAMVIIIKSIMEIIFNRDNKIDFIEFAFLIICGLIFYCVFSFVFNNKCFCTIGNTLFKLKRK